MSREKKVRTESEKRVIRILTIVSIFAIAVFAWSVYANDYYRAEATARKAMLGSEKIEVQEKENYYLISTDAETTQEEKGIIFYPGGKVEENEDEE